MARDRAAAMLSERDGVPFATVARALYRSEQEKLRERLDADAFGAAWKAGTQVGCVADLL